MRASRRPAGERAVRSRRRARTGKGPQRRPQKRVDRRLQEVAIAVGGGYCRLQMPLRLALAVRETVAGRRLGALEGGGGKPLPFSCNPPPPLSTHGPQLGLRWMGRVGPDRERPLPRTCACPSVESERPQPTPFREGEQARTRRWPWGTRRRAARTVGDGSRGEQVRPEPNAGIAPSPLSPPPPPLRRRGRWGLSRQFSRGGGPPGAGRVRRPLLREKGRVRGQKNVCVPQIGLKFPAPLITLIFWPEEKFSDVGGERGGRPGLPRAPNNPLPPSQG